MASSFKIFQSNVQSLSSNRSEIQRILEADKYDVALLSETWTQNNLEKTNKYRITNYHQILHSRPDNYGGAAILLRNSYNYYPIQIPTLSEFTQSVAIRVANLDLILASIYVSPSISISTFEDDMNKVINALRPFTKTVIGGDFNAHHFVWDSELDKTDRRGEILMQIINDHNLLLLNDGTKTFVPVQVNRRSSAVDLTMCTAAIFPNAIWKVLDVGVGGSHHLALETILSTTQANNEARFIYNHKRINEDISRLELQGVEDLISNVRKISKNHKKKAKHDPRFWWSEDVDKAWKEKAEARRNFNNTSSKENLIEFKRRAAIFQRKKTAGDA